MGERSEVVDGWLWSLVRQSVSCGRDEGIGMSGVVLTFCLRGVESTVKVGNL